MATGAVFAAILRDARKCALLRKRSLNDLDSNLRNVVPAGGHMTQARDLSHFVHHLDGGVARMELAVEGIHCGGCMRTIENGLAAMPNIVRARVNLTDRRVAVEWRNGKVDPNGFVDRLSELGFRAYPFDSGKSAEDERREAQTLLRCLGVAAFAAMNVMLLSVAVW